MQFSYYRVAAIIIINNYIAPENTDMKRNLRTPVHFLLPLPLLMFLLINIVVSIFVHTATDILLLPLFFYENCWCSNFNLLLGNIAAADVYRLQWKMQKKNCLNVRKVSLLRACALADCIDTIPFGCKEKMHKSFYEPVVDSSVYNDDV